MSSQQIAVSFALLASCLFGLQAVAAKRGLSTTDPLTGAVITIGTMWVLYLVLTPLYFNPAVIGTPGFWIFVANGLLHPMLSMYCAIRATSHTGATLAASLTATTPVFSAILAVVLLGETVTAWIAAGTAIAVTGVVVATWHGGRLSLAIRSALLFATAAAIVRAVNLIATRWGFDFLDSVMMAGLISITVSFAGLLVMKACTSSLHQLTLTPSSGLLFFGLTGTLGAIGILSMFVALKFGPVVLIAPIIAAFPLFTLIGERLFTAERLSGRALSGCLLILFGVLIVSTA